MSMRLDGPSSNVCICTVREFAKYVLIFGVKSTNPQVYYNAQVIYWRDFSQLSVYNNYYVYRKNCLGALSRLS